MRLAAPSPACHPPICRPGMLFHVNGDGQGSLGILRCSACTQCRQNIQLGPDGSRLEVPRSLPHHCSHHVTHTVSPNCPPQSSLYSAEYHPSELPALERPLPCGGRRCREGGVADLRNRATEMLFRLLTSPDGAMVASAQEGLASVVTDQRSIPKPLLQVRRRMAP